METLAIVGLVGNIVQFLDFTGKLISNSIQLIQSKDGALTENINIETATNHLSLLTNKLKDAATSVGDETLEGLCKSCEGAAGNLLEALGNLKVKGKHRKWESIGKALRTIWSRDEIERFEKQLARFRDELNLHITVNLRDRLSQFNLEQSDKLKSLDSAVRNIASAIVEQRDVFSVAHDSQIALMGTLHSDTALTIQEEHEITRREILQEIRDTTSAQREPLTERSKPPSPSSNVPFCRDCDFVDRTVLLGQIHAKCSVPASRVALVGLGGVGKSQLAIEYSYQIRERASETWVFWVHASTTARFEEGYRAIADRVRLPCRNEPKADILQLVYRWLCNQESGKWVMILDNADDVAVVFGAQTGKQEPLPGETDSRAAPTPWAYLPQSPNGSILITTRNDDVAFRLTGARRDIIRVEPMDPDHALALLRKKLEDQFDLDAATELAETLDFMPLAISQAAAYIRQRAPRSSVRKYLNNFGKSERSKANLLRHDIGDLRRDPSASNSIIMIWQMSFDHIRSIRPSAAEMLSLMSFFDRQGIPDYLLRPDDKADERKDKINTSGDDDANSMLTDDSADNGFDDDITTLQNYSLITLNKEGDAFEMHRLVQLSTRKWLEVCGQLEKWKEQYIRRMSKAFPTGDYDNWGSCEKLFAHAEAAVRYPPADQSLLSEWAHILSNAGWYALNRGRYASAERMLRKAVGADEKAMGREHASTLTNTLLLALVLRGQGNYKQGVEMHQQVLESCEKVLGRDHILTLSAMASLTSAYLSQRQWKKAGELGRQVVKIQEIVLGEEHQNTLVSKSNLASSYFYQEQWKEAEELDIQVMEIRKRVLGQEHPDTITSMYNLASIYRSQQEWKKAEELQIQMLEISKRVLGQEHPTTLFGMHNYALILNHLGRKVEATGLMADCVRLRKMNLGVDHPDSILSIDVLSMWENEKDE